MRGRSRPNRIFLSLKNCLNSMKIPKNLNIADFYRKTTAANIEGLNTKHKMTGVNYLPPVVRSNNSPRIDQNDEEAVFNDN